MATMVFGYMGVPTWLGLGHITVKVELPGTGGLYRFGNVTYRGVQIGRVSSVAPTTTGATAELSLASSPKIPADVEAHVRSVSAVGEQYVDLIPRGEGPPFLSDGSVIKRQDTTIPQRVGPMLDQLNALVKSVPKEKVSDLLDESFLAFNGAGYDFQSLLDSGSRIAADANATASETTTLIDDSAPLLDSQVRSAESLRAWSDALSVVTGQVVDNDPELRKVLATGPDTADEVARLLDQLKPTLPVLLANMTTVGEIGVTYNPSLRQLLVLLPPYVAGFGSLSSLNNPTGMSLGAFSLMMADPPVCTMGFLPPSQWRSPADETTIDTPENLYCKLPQDSPIAVRGVRNNPCMGQPGQARTVGRDLQQRRGVHTAGHASARARALSVRPQLDLSGRTTRPSGKPRASRSWPRSRALLCRRGPCRPAPRRAHPRRALLNVPPVCAAATGRVSLSTIREPDGISVRMARCISSPTWRHRQVRRIGSRCCRSDEASGPRALQDLMV